MAGIKIVLDGYRIDKKTGKPVRVEKRISRPAAYAKRKRQQWKAASK